MATMTQTVTRPFAGTPKREGIYRLLQPGDLLESRDAMYSPQDDVWWLLSLTSFAYLIGTPYDPAQLGPVRRFNKPA